MKTSLIILMLFPFTVYGLTVDEWLAKYQRPCKSVSANKVCKERLDRSLQKMKNSKVPKILEENNLPLWLATIPIIESDYDNNAISKAGAVGAFQIMPYNIQQFYIRRRNFKMPLKTISGIKIVNTIIETKPTIEACRELAKDIEINTKIASWLLKRLYQKYNDWHLALMAYNSGDVRVDNYLKGKGPPLKFETENYFQQLMAIQKYIEGIE